MVCTPDVNLLGCCAPTEQPEPSNSTTHDEDVDYDDDTSLSSHGSDDNSAHHQINVDHMKSTPLMEAIQQNDWGGVDFFLETGTFSFSPFQHRDRQRGSPEDQAETFVVCKDPNNGRKVIWRQLPLHAAICYGAPNNTIQLILRAYPRAARCVDNEGNLPLHLTVKFNRPNHVLQILLKEYPKAIQIRNKANQKPLECYHHPDPSSVEGKLQAARFEVFQTIMNVKKLEAQRIDENLHEQIRMVRRLTKQAKVDLEADKNELQQLQRNGLF